jgi:hypothetical protein
MTEEEREIVTLHFLRRGREESSSIKPQKMLEIKK